MTFTKGETDMSTCAVIGTLADVGLDPVAGAELRFDPAFATTTYNATTVVIPTSATAVSGTSGEFTVDLLPGRYRLTISSDVATVSRALTITVPSLPSIYLAQILKAQAAQEAMSDTFIVNRGTDLAFSFNWPDGGGGSADLTGYTISAFEADPAIASYLSLTLVDAANGLISGVLAWNDALPMGRVASFRVRITKDGTHTTTSPLWVQYQ